MKIHILFLLLSSLLFAGSCGKSKKKDVVGNPGEKISNPSKTEKTDKEEEVWVWEGSFNVLKGIITSGSGKKPPIRGGEKISVFVHLAGLEKNTDLKAKVQVAGPEGIVYTDERTLLAADRIKKTTGIVGVIFTSDGAWVSGKYSVEVNLSQGVKKGKIIAPFTLESIATVSSSFQLENFAFPQVIAAGRTYPAYFLLRGIFGDSTVKAFFDTKKKDGSIVSSVSKKWDYKNGTKQSIWQGVVLTAPADEGEYQVLIRFEKDNKKINTGEKIIVKSVANIANPMVLTSSAQIRKLFYRQEEGILAAMIFSAEEKEMTLDIGITGPDRGVYLINRGIKVKGGPKGHPVALPFTVPEFAPAGDYHIKLRIKDGSVFTENQIQFRVGGEELKPPSSYRATMVELGNNGIFTSVYDKPLSNGTVYASFILEGMKNDRKKRAVSGQDLEFIEIDNSCTFSIYKPLMEAPEFKSKPFEIKGTYYHQVMRLRVNSAFKPRPHLKGRYTLRLDCEDKKSDRATQLTKPVTFK
ncbi:hypothetical protein KKF34_14495 [Myxococcota bacterium]|nr:hypothetical protein [Myxococcota bacterium]MBU1383148.1 hypothetical protein [Myxococcota bacterium]MBU1498083.1 hypothetical protein [Myxococcota bacterium]